MTPAGPWLLQHSPIMRVLPLIEGLKKPTVEGHMIVLELNEDDATRLCSGLDRFLVELEREIARTDSREYRQDLRRPNR